MYKNMTNPIKRGIFNYYTYRKEKDIIEKNIWHGSADVISTWLPWGTGPDDPTTSVQRLEALKIGDKIGKYYKNEKKAFLDFAATKNYMISNKEIKEYEASRK